MTNLTISIPDEVYVTLKKYPFINWSAVCRIALKAAVEALTIEHATVDTFEKKIATILLEILK